MRRDLVAVAMLAASGLACSPRAPGPVPARVAASPEAAAAPSCEVRSPAAPAMDLYCLELVPTARAEGATGVVRLERPQTPFGVAVTAGGSHVHELVVDVAGLPDPATLGAYTTYVAWLTTPILDPVVRLGAVANGRQRLGRAAFDKFLVLVSAERSADVA